LLGYLSTLQKFCVKLASMTEPSKTPEELEAEGDCYVEAANALMFPVPREGWVLIHGRPTLRRSPWVQFGHAWLEQGEQVYDPSSGFRGARALYYMLGKIDPDHNHVYTVEETRKLLLDTEHYGPWEGVDAI